MPELRHVHIDVLDDDVAWVLPLFEDLQRCGQLEYFYLSGRVRFTSASDVPRATSLQQWLALNKSSVFRFRMKLNVDYVLEAESTRREVFDEYRRATGDRNAARDMQINIRLPQMTFTSPATTDDGNLQHFDAVDDDECASKNGQRLDEHIEEVLSSA